MPQTLPQASSKLALPYIQPSQAQKHVTHNEALQRLDFLAQLTILGFRATVPPATPTEGDVWALGTSAQSAWAGQDGMLAGWYNGAWVFIAPKVGWRGAQEDELRIWSGTAWELVSDPDLQNLDGVGINASFDAVNLLSVSADATLLNHDGAGHQLKLNKVAAADTASLLFQTGFLGRAEMGTAGTDDFAIKVSADGAAWNTALVAQASDGQIALPSGAGLSVTGRVTGTAVTQSHTDQAAGRLVKTRDFGLGTAITLTSGDDLNALVSSGLYYNPTGGNCAGNNYPMTSAGVLINQRRTSTNWVQQFTSYGGSTSGAAALRQYTRTYGAARWTPWVEMMHQGRMVGAVNQSGGVPTGSVIERGANANGSYARFADGTQICTLKRSVAAAIDQAYLGGFRCGTQTWVFPAQFAAGTDTTLAGSALDGTGFSVIFEGATGVAQTGWNVTAITTQTSATRSVTLSATGRWF